MFVIARNINLIMLKEYPVAVETESALHLG